MTRSIVSQLDFQAIRKKIQETLARAHRVRRGESRHFRDARWHLAAQGGHTLPYDWVERQAKFVIDNYPDHTQRRSSQRIWVLASRWPLVDRPKADERINLIRQRDRDRNRIARHEIVWTLRLVMIL